MKILAINASHRGDQGYTRFLIDRLFQDAILAGPNAKSSPWPKSRSIVAWVVRSAIRLNSTCAVFTMTRTA